MASEEGGGQGRSARCGARCTALTRWRRSMATSWTPVQRRTSPSSSSWICAAHAVRARSCPRLPTRLDGRTPVS
eukprot:213419-Chlamydomonas_euryale.AAC.1